MLDSARHQSKEDIRNMQAEIYQQSNQSWGLSQIAILAYMEQSINRNANLQMQQWLY